MCLVCRTKFILRVGIGLEKVCEHTFDCPSCFTPITIEARTAEPPIAWLEMKENIERIAEHAGATVVINLHPSFAFRLDEYHSPFAFASMQAGRLIHPHARVPASSRFSDVALHFEVPQTTQIWPIVKNVLTLAVKGDPAQVLQTQVARYENSRREFKPDFQCKTAFKTAASFFDDIFFPAIGKFRSPLRQFAKNQKSTNEAEFRRLIEFYSSELAHQNFDQYLSTFTDYFKHFDHFRQVLAHARVGDEAVDDLVVGSKRFDDIKLYYGQAYETLTSAYTLLAVLFNLSQGRAFDQFSSMTLKKYISDVEKAKRSNPFMGVPDLASFTRFDDSALRNGSHHASIWRDRELIKFRSGGTGAEREMSFSRYLHTCNGITIALAALFLVELELTSPIGARYVFTPPP